MKKGKQNAVLPVLRGKTRTMIRIDDEVLAWFRKRVHAVGGRNYQTLINLALHDHIERPRKSLEPRLRRLLREKVARARENGFRRGRDYEQARQRWLDDMKNPRDLGTGGKITWTR